MLLCPLCLRFWEPISTVREDEIQELEMPGNNFLPNQKSQVAVRLKTNCLFEAVYLHFTFITVWGSKQCYIYIMEKETKSQKSEVQFSSVQSLSPVRLFVTPWTTAHQASLSITKPWSLPKLTSIELVMPSNHLILCRPLLLLPSIFPSIRVFSNESALHTRWPKYWSFSLNIRPFNEHPGLISFRMDWLDVLAVQGTLKSLLQHKIQKHQFFGSQLSL